MMASLSAKVPYAFRFLTGLDEFTCRVPEGTLTDQPEVSSVIRFEDEDRQLVFRPNSSAIGPEGDVAFEFSTARGNVQISAYLSDAVPPRHLLFWRLANGVVATFVPEPDARYPADVAPGRRGVDAIVQAVSIDDSGPIPRVLGGGPVGVGGRFGRPGADRVALQNAYGWPSVNFVRLFRRPALVSNVKEAPWQFSSPEEFMLVWADSPAGVRVECLGPNQQADVLKELAAEVAGSVVTS
jgi:hypothetical protein